MAELTVPEDSVFDEGPIKAPAHATGALVLISLAMMISLAFGAVGLAVGMRASSPESVQSIFPLIFVFLFMSSMSLLISSAVLALPIGVLAGLGAPLWLMALAPVYGLVLAEAGRRLAATRAYPRLPELLASVSRAS